MSFARVILSTPIQKSPEPTRLPIATREPDNGCASKPPAPILQDVSAVSAGLIKANV